MDQIGRSTDGYRDKYGLDSGSFSSSFEQDDINYPAPAPPTLGDLFKCPKAKASVPSPTTPFAFGTVGRQSSYSRRQGTNERMQKLNNHLADSYTPSTSEINPTTFENSARPSSHANGQSINGDLMQLHDGIVNSKSSSPLAFGSPGRTSPYGRSPARSPSMSGRIQKPRSGRSPGPFRGAKGAKLGQRSQQMDSLQLQLYNDMRTRGIDHSKIVHFLERRCGLKDLYLNRGEQQQQENCTTSNTETPQVDGRHPPGVVEDPPVHASIALLKHKFAQFERFKESTHGQQIPLYPHQQYHHERLSPAQRISASPSSCSPRVGPSSESSPDSSYEFDEKTAAILAVQQELMWNSARSSPSGTSESIASPSPNWYAAGDSPRSSKESRGEEANHALPSYPNLRPLNVVRQSNLGAFKESNLRGPAMGNIAFGGPNEVSLETLLAAEKIEAAKLTNYQKKLASSIEMAMAKLSFSLTPRLSSPKGKTQRSWGPGLSLNTPFLTDRSGGKVRGSEVPEVWSNASDVQSLYNRVECPGDIRIEHEEFVDTSLRL